MSDYEERTWKIPTCTSLPLLELLNPLYLSFLICNMRIRQGQKSVWDILHPQKPVVIMIITVTSKHVSKWRPRTIRLVQSTLAFLNTTFLLQNLQRASYRNTIHPFLFESWTDFFWTTYIFWEISYIHIYIHLFITYRGYS